MPKNNQQRHSPRQNKKAVLMTAVYFKVLLPQSGRNNNGSVKWSDPGHFLESQVKFFLSFPCTFFLHIFDT